MKTNHRITAAVLAFVMVMSLFAWGEAPLALKANAVWDGTVATSFSSGSGTQSSPYIIKTAAQMGYFRQLLSEGLTLAGLYFKLGANLDMTGGNWKSVSTEFCGDFNGNGYTLTVDTQFVGTIGAEGRVHRLKVVCPTSSSLPLLCSYNKGTVEGCIASGTVDGSESYAGGLVRENSGTMLNVAFVGTVGGDNMDVGGLVYKNLGTIDGGYCSAVLDAYSSGKYGGSSEDPVVGYSTGTITNVYYNNANGSSSCGTAMTETTMKEQSLVTALNATNSSLTTKWAMDTSSANGGFPVIVADNKSDIECSLSNTEGDAFICNSGTTFTIVKSVEKTCTIYYTTDGSNPTNSSTRVRYSTGVTITKDTTIKMVAYENGVYGIVRTQNALVMAGSGTEAAPYQITTKGQLQALSIAPEAHFVLKNDLTFTASDFTAGGVYPKGWQTIDTFSGVLDGQGHAISNMKGNSGGFISVNSGTISGIRFINHQLTGDASYFGPVVESNNGLITKCYVNLNVSTLSAGSSLYAGGIAGYSSGTISYCQIDGNMTVNGPNYRYCWIYVGGIAAGGSGVVKSCYSKLNMRIISPRTTEYVYYGGIAKSGYVYDSRNDGTVYFNVALDYDIYANAFSCDRSFNCYGDLSYTYGTSYGSNFQIDYAYSSGEYQCYGRLTGGEELLESSFPDLDFTEKWMIMANGPVPQGIMNADGKCYTKTDYRRPACDDGYTKYVDQNNNTYTQSLPLNGVHFGGSATCTSPATCEICNAAYGQVDSTNHTGIQAVTQQNDAMYPFTYADGWYTSSNKSHSTTSTYTLTALAPVTIRIDYSVSSEKNYDKLIVQKNQTTCGTYSGDVTGTLDVTLAAGDTLYIKYTKDVSVSSGTDSASFALTIPELSASCTDDLICDHCKAVVEPAWGHSYLTGVNDATYPFAYADGKFTSTNKADYTTSSYTYTASTAVNLSIDYSVSCHAYDEFLILKNGSTRYTYSGEKSGTLSISLAAGDRLVFRFSNDSSYSSGSDSASFAITSQSAVAPCTQSMTCIVCKTVTPASGHNYVDSVCTICGVEDITASGTCGANVTWRLLSSGKLIISGTGDMENYTYSTSAPWEVYRGSVKSVVIEDGVTSVGNYAFKSHSYLKDAVIGNSVITIGVGAFMYCDLSNVEIGNKVEVIGTDAFYYNFNLENVTLPETLTTIGKSAFSWCKNKLTSIDIPDSVISIGVYAFCNCDSLVTVTIGNGVISIADDAFSHCDSLTGIWVSEENTAYSSDDFGVLFNKDKTTLIQAPGALSGAYVVPDGVTTILANGFYGCLKMTGVTIPASVTQLFIESFYSCELLTGIWVDENNTAYSSDQSGVLFNKDKTILIRAPQLSLGSYAIPNTVTSIGEYAFAYCSELTDLYIPKSVTSIGGAAFYQCNKLAFVFYTGTIDQWNEISIGTSNEKLTDAVLQYHIHSYLDHASQEPTCTEIGWKAYQTCETCDYTSYEEIAATGHSWADATCSAPKTCGSCGITEGEASGPHSYQAEVVAPGCLTDGYTLHTCIYCGTSYQDAATDATGHSWTAASCTEPRKCANCGLTRGDALGHSYEAVVTAPTCTEVGYTTYTCSACDDSYVADEVASTGHSYEAVVTAPTCTEAGYTTYTCSACGDSYVEDQPATGHTYGAVVTAPTCTEGGYTTYTCSCGDSYVADEVAATGHSYEAVVTAPTCIEVGYTTYTCACGDSYVADEVATVSHTWLEATCTEPVRCDYCGTTRGEALGHLYKTVVTEPTCTAAGGKVHTCVDCGDTYISDAVDALDHGAYSYSLVDNVHTLTCMVCGNVVTKESTDGKQFRFNTASPALAVDIGMNIATTIPAGFSEPYMVVEFNGITTTLTDYTIDASNGRYVFAFPSINPQTMGDTFHATLYADVDGVEVCVSLDYSMLKYINSQLKKLTEASTLRTALSDLVMYGDANQVYESYKTDALLSTLLEDAAKANLDPSTFPGLDESYNKQATAGVKDANIDLKGVTMALGSKIMVRMTVFCADPNAYTVKATINGEDFLYPVSELSLAAGYTDRYVVEFDQIRATQFGEVITFSFLDAAGNQVGRTLEYTVYSYVQKNQNVDNESLVNLLQAIYNYGESVKNI